MPKVKKAGRPPLAKGDARNEFLRIRVTTEELKEIEKASKAKKQTVSKWIRRTLNAAT